MRVKRQRWLLMVEPKKVSLIRCFKANLTKENLTIRSWMRWRRGEVKKPRIKTLLKRIKSRCDSREKKARMAPKKPLEKPMARRISLQTLTQTRNGTWIVCHNFRREAPSLTWKCKTPNLVPKSPAGTVTSFSRKTKQSSVQSPKSTSARKGVFKSLKMPIWSLVSSKKKIKRRTTRCAVSLNSRNLTVFSYLASGFARRSVQIRTRKSKSY